MTRWRYASSLQLDYATVNPYTFAEPPAAYHQRARGQADRSIGNERRIYARLNNRWADWVLVEGAGGWFTPLSDTFTFVIGNTGTTASDTGCGRETGCINHAMLTAQAILHAGLTGGW